MPSENFLFYDGLIARNLVSGAMRMHVSGHGVNCVAVLYYCGQDGFESWQIAIAEYGISNLSDDAKRREAIWVNSVVHWIYEWQHMWRYWTFSLSIDYRRICISFKFRHCCFSDKRCRKSSSAVLHEARNSIWIWFSLRAFVVLNTFAFKRNLISSL